jgi:hypothetical protein
MSIFYQTATRIGCKYPEQPLPNGCTQYPCPGVAPEFSEYSDTFMGEAEGEAEEEAHDEPADDLGRTIAEEREKLDRILEDHKKSLYPKCKIGLKKLDSTLELLK